MRTLPIAVVAGMLTISSPGSRRTRDWSGARSGQVLNCRRRRNPRFLPGGNPYGAPPASAAGTPWLLGYRRAGQVVSPNTPVTQRWGGMGIAFVNGHRVQVDPNTGRIMRVLN